MITDSQRWAFLNTHWYSLIEGQSLHDWLDKYDCSTRFNDRIEALDYAIRLHENAERHILQVEVVDHKVSACGRCEWESSYDPPITHPTCPRCNWPEEDSCDGN